MNHYYHKNSGEKLDIHEPVPDLWHIAMSLEGSAREEILDVWYMAHNLKATLLRVDDNADPGPPAR